MNLEGEVILGSREMDIKPNSDMTLSANHQRPIGQIRGHALGLLFLIVTAAPDCPKYLHSILSAPPLPTLGASCVSQEAAIKTLNSQKATLVRPVHYSQVSKECFFCTEINYCYQSVTFILTEIKWGSTLAEAAAVSMGDRESKEKLPTLAFPFSFIRLQADI